MAKKIKIFSQAILGIAAAFTLSYAVSVKPASACVGADGKPIEGADGVVANCVDSVDESEDVVISPAHDTAYSEAGESVTSEKEISHSYFLAGNQVESKDDVYGLAAFAGYSVHFSGSAEYAALAGNSVVVSGEINNDLFVAGNAVEITEEASIGRDLFGAANSFLIKTNLNGNVFVSGNRLVLENVTIDGDVSAGFDEITIKGKSAISGTFSYNDNAVVTGLENLSTGETKTYSGAKKNITFVTTLTDKVIAILGRLLVTIVLVGVCAKFSKRLLDEFAPRSAWKYLAFGLGLIIVAPLAAVFIMVSVIGIPLGLIGLGTYILFAYLASSVTGGVLGHLLAEKVFKQSKMHILLQYTIGVILIELLSLVPYIGALVTALSACFGFGYLVRKVFRQPVKAKK